MHVYCAVARPASRSSLHVACSAMNATVSPPISAPQAPAVVLWPVEWSTYPSLTSALARRSTASYNINVILCSHMHCAHTGLTTLKNVFVSFSEPLSCVTRRNPS